MVRYAVAATAAVVVTFALFGMMQELIAMGDPQVEEVPPNRPIDMHRPKRDTPVDPDRPRFPERPPTPPPTPKTPPFPHEGQEPETRGIAPPEVDPVLPPPIAPRTPTPPADSDAIPVVRVQPRYPRAAAERRIEGWVDVTLTVSTTGAVKSARVVAAEPPGVFESATLRAVRHWKYKPRIDGGKAVERSLRVRLTFELDDEL